jgi:hypothetical protein
MRTASFLFALCLAAVLALAQISSLHTQSPVPQAGTRVTQRGPDSRGIDSVRMWSRAEIRVLPLDVIAANRVELQSLRDRQKRIEADSRKLELSDPAVREQISRQLQLVRAALAYADRQDSDYGKSPSAMEVQRHLNRIEGQTMCEACHTSVVARN